MRIEIRSDSVIIQGYVNAVGRESRVLPSPKGRFKETIVPKTFQKALMKGNNVDLLFNHDRNQKLGSTATGELDLREDNIGLRATAKVTDPTVMQLARDGKLQGWSFGMQVEKDTWSDGEDGIQRRMVEDIHLAEVSILDKQPAYLATSIEARNGEETLTEQRMEEFSADIEDRTEKEEEHKKQNTENRESIDYSNFEFDIKLLQIKGRN